MLDRKLHKFYLSFKTSTDIELVWVEGINLRHAKEKLLMKYPEATDVMDWTYEKPEDLDQYKAKFYQSKKEEWMKNHHGFYDPLSD